MGKATVTTIIKHLEPLEPAPLATELTPGKTYILRFNQPLSCETVANIREVLKEQAPGIKFLVMEGGVDIFELESK